MTRLAPVTAEFQAERPVAAPHAMVVTEQDLATKAGVAVLKAGGNAVDAAIAVAYALAVVDPCCGNIGGGGFMLVRMADGRSRFIDFREVAPAAATANMYLDSHGNIVPGRSTKGWLAIGVPGTVAGMERARKEFATLSRARLMAPAIALARDGFTLRQGDLVPFAGAKREIGGRAGLIHVDANVRSIFYPHNRFPRTGDRLVQSQLARTLMRISNGGASAFYDGAIARAVVAASKMHGGLLTLRDFATYRVGESAPLSCTYNGTTLLSAPPPSSGGVVLCETLNILSGYPLALYGWHSAREVHVVAEAERRAYADRNTYLGDPNFVRNPLDALLSPIYAAKLRAQIAPEKATPSIDVQPGLGPLGHENNETTHFSIVDAAGNAVAVTYTINDWFGSGVIAGTTGFLLNDEMDDFTSKPGVANMYGLVQGKRNAIVGGKRPLSSMDPTIAVRNHRVFMVTGSPGGSRIPTIVLETLLNVLDFGMNVQQAVDAPRIHMQWLPDAIQYEPGAMTATTMAKLHGDGYVFEQVPFWGSAQAIVIDPKSGMRFGGTDRRRPAGSAMGY